MWDAIGWFLGLAHLPLSQRGRSLAGEAICEEKECEYMLTAKRCKDPKAMAHANANARLPWPL